MNRIDTDSMVDLLFQVKWKSDDVTHTDCFQANQVNMWRDIFPADLSERIMGSQAGRQYSVTFGGGRGGTSFGKSPADGNQTQAVPLYPAGKSSGSNHGGTFLPQRTFNGYQRGFQKQYAPFRCVGINNGQLSVDFNHPLADKDLHLSTIIGKVEPKRMTRRSS